MPSLAHLKSDRRSPRLFKATKYGHSVAVLIPKALIPQHEGRDDIFEVTLSRKSGTEELVLYMTHLPGYKRAYLDLFQCSAALGDSFAVNRVRRYGLEQFCRDYNENVPVALSNTRLSYGEPLKMRVEHLDVELEAITLRTYQGQVILEFAMGIAGVVKIVKRLGKFEVRLEEHSPVTGLSKTSGTLMITYQRTSHDSHPHRRIVV